MSKKINFFLATASALLLLGAGCIQFGAPSGPAALGPAGMFRSADKGETWLPIDAMPTAGGVKSIAGVNVYRIFTDPMDPGAMYLTSRGQGLFYTYDNGDSWDWVPALGGKFIYALVVDPSNKCVIYASDDSRIYKTTDCSRTWQTIYAEERPSQRPASLAVDYGNPKIIYAALVGGDIIASSDAGDSWQTIKRFGFSVQFMTADKFYAKRLYVASYQNGLFRSDDGGASWINLTAGLTNYAGSLNFYRLILHPGKRGNLFWISKYGILRSNDAGATWSDYKLITPPGSINIYSFAVNPADDREIYYVGTILGEKNVPIRSTFYKSVDSGKSWITKKLPSGNIPVYLRVHPVNPNYLFMGFTAGE